MQGTTSRVDHIPDPGYSSAMDKKIQAHRSIVSEIDMRLFIPLVSNTVLLHIAVLLERVNTTYRALELDLSVLWIGVISASFSLLPAILAVPVGRIIDHGHDALTTWVGSGLVLAACLGFWLIPASAVSLMLNTALLGVGQLACMAGHQMVSVRASKGQRGRDAIFGYHMVAIAAGQGIGPFIISWLAGSAAIPPTGLVYAIGVVVAIVCFGASFGVTAAPAGHRAGGAQGSMRIADLVRVNGLVAYMMASVITITGLDIIVIYLPVLGAERNIDAGTIGLLLGVRAAASMFARLVYVPLMDVLGRMALTCTTMLAPAVAFAFISAPIPLWLMYVAVIVAGLGLGVSATLTLSGVVDVAPVHARGAALSLRLMGNRVGLVVFPFGASVIATASGVGGVFILVALLLAGATGGVWRAGQRRE